MSLICSLCNDRASLDGTDGTMQSNRGRLGSGQVEVRGTHRDGVTQQVVDVQRHAPVAGLGWDSWFEQLVDVRSRDGFGSVPGRYRPGATGAGPGGGTEPEGARGTGRSPSDRRAPDSPETDLGRQGVDVLL